MNALIEFKRSGNKIKKTKDYVTLALKCCSIFFSVGILSEVYFHLISQKYILLTIDIISVMMIGAATTLNLMKKVSSYNGLLLCIFILSINQYCTIIYEGIYPGPYSGRIIILHAATCIIPLIISGVPNTQFAPFVISLGTIGAYTTACLFLNDLQMYRHMPQLVIIMLGIALIIWFLNKSYSEEMKTIQINNEQEQLRQFFELEPEQWRLIKNSKITPEKTEELLHNLGKRMRDTIIDQAKNLIYTNEEMIDILRKRNTDMTSSEMEICCYIIQGKTVREICEIRHISPSTVTSTRSRIRAKLGLEKNENLQQYLRTLYYTESQKAE
ncbi:LuxR family transcriptional regulator [Dysgonomonas sp. 521]|uniref:helix-turn-helix transcriptional regulator n=1 Tax=Dysgonomonas sp. 521 TaxID=2302932 RepID=UPI0013D5D674|nr:helix-turn-helix transcriptional regulator [Dysgonomonas sp. 521]NDV94834.1 LuxR family transcriptional regulator [Dysgonomonas sp. 521]